MYSTYAATPAARNPAPMLPAPGPRSDDAAPHWLDPVAAFAPIVRKRRNEEIVGQGEVSDDCCRIVSGCVRTAMVMEDGRRQIGEFLFPGDLLGYEASGGQSFAVSAVSDVVLHRFRRSAIDAYAGRDAVFDAHLRQYMAAQLRAARNRLAVLGRGTAEERIMSFLREMHARLAPAGSPSFVLPMKLTDIADYLGLALETVCRGMADLRRAGVVATNRSQIALLPHGHGSRALH